MRALFAAVCATLLFVGLSRLNAESTASGDDIYVLHVEQVECNISHMQTLNVATGRPPAVIMIARDQMVSFPDSKVVKFPDLKLVSGQQGEIDQQKPFRFASAFDAEGNPTKFDTRGIGLKISATILGVTNRVIPNISTGVNRTNNCVDLKLFFENVTVSFSTNEAAKIESGYPKRKDYKVPIVRSQHMKGDMKLPLGHWSDLGGTVIEESRYMTCYLKVEKK